MVYSYKEVGVTEIFLRIIIANISQIAIENNFGKQIQHPSKTIIIKELNNKSNLQQLYTYLNLRSYMERLYCLTVLPVNPFAFIQSLYRFLESSQRLIYMILGQRCCLLISHYFKSFKKFPYYQRPSTVRNQRYDRRI